MDPEAYCRAVMELLRSGPTDRFTGAEPTEILFVLSCLVDCASSAEEFAERLALLAGEVRPGPPEVRPGPPTVIARAAGAILRDWGALNAEASQGDDPAADR